MNVLTHGYNRARRYRRAPLPYQTMPRLAMPYRAEPNRAKPSRRHAVPRAASHPSQANSRQFGGIIPSLIAAAIRPRCRKSTRST